ncbi:crossover junction endodeoxyribonuclease RuvC [Spirochaeta africana]|uniref:Crossover junction endodeoxyribonuclease RuvC n=1 Tax=Spirochaeta africana (strain ATCC 700263 / DSM 8902 / Z-7692) TaxID=889378 RepID=H9UJB9_SPIAZ|nr:crossover junction endodeoxyribonuclease RuvC [Spirochaeta africana]AFG37612.1 crossover junction endodeoxyribonuclease RuvC [Spirochaeta africana DSM 8902]
MRRIIGIDPGLAETGIGVIGVEGSSYRHLHHQTIRTASSAAAGPRLSDIYTGVIAVIREYRPEGAGIETLYFSRNASSALPVAQARGVILLALQHQGVETAEYTPQAIKQALVGYGRADKQQVQHMVRVVLGLSDIPASDHAADALAAAVCHANTAGFMQRLPGGSVV